MAKTVRKNQNQLTALRAGVINGASTNDPAGIATFMQVGSTTGFGLAWLVAIVTPLVITIEDMSARIGIVTKKGLNASIRSRFGESWAIIAGLIVLICNTATIGANIAAISEIMGAGLNLHWEWLVIPVVLLISLLMIEGSYKSISKYLLILTLSLLLYVLAIFNTPIDLASIWQQLWPINLGDGSLLWLIAAVAILGTTITPNTIFWQATEEVEEQIKIKSMRQERQGVMIGFIYANLIALAVMLMASLVLGGTQLVGSATEAAQMLRPLAGDWAFGLFALGIIGSGFLGIPILAASTAYTGTEALKLPEGLNRKVKQARGFYILLVGSLIVGGLLVLTHIPPMIMLLYTQVLNGILTPILILLTLIIANDKKIMGRHVNGWLANLLGLISIGLMVLFGGWLITKLF
jgi:Mn2+/Fe2+ NRAMP family transporter